MSERANDNMPKDLRFALDATILNAQPASFTFSTASEPVVIFRPDGTFEFPKGETREAAKAFWDYVEQYMADSYRRHAASARLGE